MLGFILYLWVEEGGGAWVLCLMLCWVGCFKFSLFVCAEGIVVYCTFCGFGLVGLCLVCDRFVC